MIASVFLLCMASAYELGAGVTPVQKVISMLEAMQQKAGAEKEAEAKAFEEYQDFCKYTAVEKEQNIQTATDDIERLSAHIQKDEASAAKLADEIAELDANIAQWNSDHEAATEVRVEERATYEATHADYLESLDALERAIVTLSQQNYDREQAASLIQKVVSVSRKMSPKVDALTAFLSTEALQPSAPQADAYQFQSGGVVDLLKKLKGQFSDERSALEKEEANTKHEFNMLALELKDSVKYASKERSEKAAQKAAHQQAAGENKGVRAETQTAKAEDEKYLKELNAQCRINAESFHQRQQVRAEEVKAIGEAVQILGSDAVSGSADKHLPALVQTSFALLRASSTSAVQQRVAALLQQKGTKLGSKALALVAAAATADPLEKVRSMIRNLIAKLQEEAGAEANHKAWCDGELHNNKNIRDEKTGGVDLLTAKSTELQAAIAKLAQQITDLQTAIQQLDAALAEATEVRNKEKATNEETIADAMAASEAVARATEVLKNFYSNAAALVQGPKDDAPHNFEGVYNGQQSESTGVMGMLEVIASDFSRLESETRADEDIASREFATFSEETTADKNAKVAEVKSKNKKKIRKEETLSQTEADLRATQEELDAANGYYDELKASCLDAGVSYEDRVARRQEEIESLQDAWRILDGSD